MEIASSSKARFQKRSNNPDDHTQFFWDVHFWKGLKLITLLWYMYFMDKILAKTGIYKAKFFANNNNYFKTLIWILSSKDLNLNTHIISYCVGLWFKVNSFINCWYSEALSKVLFFLYIQLHSLQHNTAIYICEWKSDAKPQTLLFMKQFLKTLSIAP